MNAPTIDCVVLGRPPIYERLGKQWRQTVPFRVNGAPAEIDLCYDYLERDWHSSPVYFSCGAKEAADARRGASEEELLAELYQTGGFEVFIESRGRLYEELAKTLGKPPQGEDAKMAGPREVAFFVEGTRLAWKASLFSPEEGGESLEVRFPEEEASLCLKRGPELEGLFRLAEEQLKKLIPKASL